MSVFDFNEHKDPTTNSPHTRLDRSGIPTTPGSRLRTQAGTAIVAQCGFPRSTPGSPARRPKCEISCAVAGSHSPSYRRWLPCGIFVLRPPERMGQQPNPGTEAPSGASFFVPFVAIQFQPANVHSLPRQPPIEECVGRPAHAGRKLVTDLGMPGHQPVAAVE